MAGLLRVVLSTFLFAASLVPSMSAQQGDDAASLAARAEDALNKQDYAAARSLATAALARFEEQRDHRGIGRVRVVLGNVAFFLGEREVSAAEFSRAIEAFDAAGYPRGRAIALLGLTMSNGASTADNQVLGERAVADARAAGDPAVEARILHAMGDGAFWAGEYAAALEKYEAAAALFERAGQQEALGTVHNSLGRLYRTHGRADAALSHQLQALALHEKRQGSFTHLQSLDAVALTYQALGDMRSARRYFTQALAIADKVASPRIQDTVRANALDAMIAENDLTGAAVTLEGVIARGLDQFPSLRHRQLASVYMTMGRSADALPAAGKAIATCGAPESLECVKAHDQRAAVYLALGHRDEALADALAALDALESARKRLVPSDFFKQQFTEAEQSVYSRAIALQMTAGRAPEALGISELARSRAFVDLLASRDIQLQDTTAPTAPPLVFRGSPGPGAVPGGVRPGDDLSSSVALPAASTGDLVEAAGRLQSTVLSYWVADDDLFIWVVKPDGTIQGSKVAVRRARLSALVDATAPRVPVADATSEPLPAGRLVTRGAQPIALQAARPAAWSELYDVLIRPVRSTLPQSPGALLTIIPHGPLSALAFAGLLDSRGRYLVEDFTLHYVPAGAVLQFTMRQRDVNARSGRLLLVADPALRARSKLDQPLPPLPGARAEARAIAGLLPAPRITTLEGRAATKPTVTGATDGKAMLHFATHAIVRDDDPLASYLALSPNSNEDDGVLSAKEIYHMRIQADLVVLSACRAAAGRVTGDGIAAFARSFIYAGVPTVVASVWDVADEPTNRLLPQFYRAWLSGATKAVALRSAQLLLLRDLRAGRIRIETPVGAVTLPEHPMFWAGFAVIGEPD